VTIVVWVGYDNAGGTHRTLGQGSTGASVALPIFQSIIRAAWVNGVPKVALAQPSREARALIADLPIDLGSGERLRQGGGHAAFIEHFRLDAKGALVERKTRFGADGEDSALALRKKAQDHVRVARAARRASPRQNVVMQCFLFFCNTRWQ
jgi:membrane carboxypeptidase/penicillin-binding protein